MFITPKFSFYRRSAYHVRQLEVFRLSQLQLPLDIFLSHDWPQHIAKQVRSICSADGPTHTESNKLYRKVKHRHRPNLSPHQRPTAKAASIWQRSRRRQRRGEPHTEHGLGTSFQH